MKAFFIAAGAASLLFASSARAIDENGYTLYGFGASSCGRFLKDIRTEPTLEMDYQGWLTGFLSAVNQFVVHRNSILEGTDLDGAMGWIQSYCETHPADSFHTAVREFVRNQQGLEPITKEERPKYSMRLLSKKKTRGHTAT
ncbi:MAG: hypothetical protein ACKVRO_16345 [Micropepsaceae bacterium]